MKIPKLQSKLILSPPEGTPSQHLGGKDQKALNQAFYVSLTILA